MARNGRNDKYCYQRRRQPYDHLNEENNHRRNSPIAYFIDFGWRRACSSRLGIFQGKIKLRHYPFGAVGLVLTFPLGSALIR